MGQNSKIDELERLLNSEEDTPIQILPNGEIREVGQVTQADMGTKKPLTMRENLGGEYAMDITRIQREFSEAQKTFSLVELHPTADGTVYAKAGVQIASDRYYVLSIKFPDSYPNEMPRVFIDAPTITNAPHIYTGGHICYLHPSMWNPGAHHLTFVIARAAKWLSKYEVWRDGRGWPGAEIKH